MSNGINSPYGLVAVESVSGDGATRKMKGYTFSSDPQTGVTGISNAIYHGDPVKFQTGQDKTKLIAGFIVNAFTGPAIPNADPPTAYFTNIVPGPFLGTFIGCQYTDVVTSRVIESSFLPANFSVLPGTKFTIFVNDDPNTIFKVQMSTSSNNTIVISPGYSTTYPSVFQNWMIGQNAMLQVGGIKFTQPVLIPTTSVIPAQNPTVPINGSQSVVYLDGSSITLVNGGSTGATNPNGGGSGNPTFDVKIIGLAPSSASVFVPGGLNFNLTTTSTPGVDLPFCDVLVKFNNHVFGSQGTPGPFNAA